MLFIKRAKSLGFTLTEVCELLARAEATSARCEDVRKIAVAKLKEVEEKLDHLFALKKELKKLIRQCVRNGSVRECSIIQALTTGGEK